MWNKKTEANQKRNNGIRKNYQKNMCKFKNNILEKIKKQIKFIKIRLIEN